MDRPADPLTFKIGHHTDLWIALHVMEWPVIREWMPYSDYISAHGGVIVDDRAQIFRYGTIPDNFLPSSKMEDALEVLRKMIKKGWDYVITSKSETRITTVVFTKTIGRPATAELEPLAICRAAGLAVLSEQND